MARKAGRSRDFGGQLKALLQEALALWHAHRDGAVADFKVGAEAPQAEFRHDLRDQRLKDPDNQQLLNELAWHHDRGNLLRFLEDSRLEPTNNRVERALRPFVIGREVSQYSKNDGDTPASQGESSCVWKRPLYAPASCRGAYYPRRLPLPRLS